jgi:hypothetical protein
VGAAVACVFLAGCAADERASGRDAKRVAADGAPAPRETAAPIGETAAPIVATAPRIVVTRDNPGLPAGCRPRRLARRIATFFDAFNRGDPSAVDYTDPSRGWYSVTDGRPRRHFVTSSREGLLGFFARRHRHGERLRLAEVDVDYARGLGHIAFRIDRRADDLRRLGITGTTAHGKGAMDCKTGEIVVWSMGMPPGRGHPPFQICPPPPKPTRAVVACARRSG